MLRICCYDFSIIYFMGNMWSFPLTLLIQSVILQCLFLFSPFHEAEFCLKYYRAPRHPVRCVMIVLVERRSTDCKNKWSSLFETTYSYRDFNVGYMCVLFVHVQNCECEWRDYPVPKCLDKQETMNKNTTKQRKMSSTV